MKPSKLEEKCKSINDIRTDLVVEKALRDIMVDFLRGYYLDIGGRKVLPLEVEAYYYHPGYYDKSKETVHNDPKKRNIDNFGKLYSHGAGLDVCLSTSKDVRFGMLIRWAEVDGTILKPGPLILYDELKKGYGEEFYSEQEARESVLCPNGQERKDRIYFSSRIGLSKNLPDHDAELRAVMIPSLRAELPDGGTIRKKEELLRGYLSRHPEDASESFIKAEIGYIPKDIRENISL